MGIAVPIGCLVPLATAIAVLVGVGVIVGMRSQAATTPRPSQVLVRVVDDGAKGGPAVISTQIVPLH